MDDYVAPPYDIERMKRALEGPSVPIPQGLTAKEIMIFMDGADAAFKAMDQSGLKPPPQIQAPPITSIIKLTCNKCGVDRALLPCPQPYTCPVVGEAQAL